MESLDRGQGGRADEDRRLLSSTALALVLTAALLHATWNLAAKSVTGDRVGFVWVYAVASAAIWVPIGVAWVVVSGDAPTWRWALGAVVSAVLHVVYQLVLQRGYGEGDLNLVYPLARGSAPLLTFVVAVAVLGERPGAAGAAGVAAVVAGVLLISLGGRRVRHRRAGVVWGLTTGATIASYTLWDSYSVNGLGVPPVPYFALGLLLQLPFLAVLVHRRGAPTRVVETWASARTQAVTIAVLSPLAYLLVLHAMQLAPVALVAAGREASIVVGAGFGWLVLREARPARRLTGAAIVLLGIGLLAVG